MIIIIQWSASPTFLFFPCTALPDVNLETSLESAEIGHQALVDLAKDTLVTDEMNTEKAVELQKSRSYVSQSAVALRCRVMPPPCLKNPYLKDVSEFDADPFGHQRSKCAGFYPAGIGGDGLSRYRTDFHEIEAQGFNGSSSFGSFRFVALLFLVCLKVETLKLNHCFHFFRVP
ncbi:UNVERIFIED_CONTAM: Wee1-like protein kinase [Sesamum radiatum]|uniref:Wee1-like protein kinase n=1 Tax=Sesamum radiatum TaxID=300843 RepID=A0AAW2UPJ8_SESRA